MKNIIILFGFLIALSSCKSKSNVINATKKQYVKKKLPNSSKKIRKYKPTNTSKKAVKKTVITKNVKENTPSSSIAISNKIIKTALSFQGTKYKHGGTTEAGMDCSGLIYTSFNLANIKLPRTSFGQSKKGIYVPISKIKIGDLLFFKTSKENKISHVGLVVSINSKNIEFIHTSTSKGVVISSLNETYWSKAFSIAKRVN